MTSPALHRLDALWTGWTGRDVEHLSLTSGADLVVATGTIAATGNDGLFRARYRIACDGGWRVREVDVAARTSVGQSTLALRADGRGHWATASGERLPALEGALDVDLSASPFTNTLPIRRLGSAVGRTAQLPMVYVQVPGLTAERVDQRYTCLEASPAGGRWRFESVDSGFTAELPVDANGLVLDYPGLFRRLWPPPPGVERPPLVVVFLIEAGGRLLLLRRSAAKDHAPGEWETGSGRVVPGESPLEAVAREAREETGLAVEIVDPVDTYRFPRGAAREEHEAIVFHCRAAGGVLTVSWEHDQARWVPLDEAPVEALPPTFRQSVERLRSLRLDGPV